ncbi:MAG TPA: hypothetical protein DCM44_17610, partial [Pantoea sp.]|nr:hypothetical protein [Pantoea sp.]
QVAFTCRAIKIMNNNRFARFRGYNKIIAVACERFNVRSIEIEFNHTWSGQIDAAATQLRGDSPAFRRY